MFTDTSDISFRLSIETEEASLYVQKIPPMPIPRVGEDVFVGMRELSGYWRVKEVFWRTPSIGAMEPGMWVTLRVVWSPVNTKPAPRYDELKGWYRD